jgi:hypothetical protein
MYTREQISVYLSVGGIPVVYHEPEATGVVDTGALVNTVSDGTVHSAAAKVTWADVARKSTVAATCGHGSSKSRGQDSPRRNEFVLRSLSRNNPVIKVKA